MVDQKSDHTIYDDWAAYWEANDIDRSDMLAFYRSLITDDTRSLAELACGTGTITIPLAHHLLQRNASARIVGIDHSEGMLRLARARNQRIEWILGDIRSPPIQGVFDLVICCFNTLQELLTDDDLSDAFCGARQLLSARGLFAFDLYQPNPTWLATPQVNRLARSRIDEQGSRIELREDTSYDPVSRIVTFNWRLVGPGSAGQPVFARMRFYVRQYFPADIDRLLAAAGLAVRECYGDFERSPFTKDSKKQVLMCGRAG